jgi:hypothetical protein
MRDVDSSATARLSLSQISSWDTGHLQRAAVEWRKRAESWENAFSDLHRGMLAPGGRPWRGEAADAIQQRAYTDLVKARRLADASADAAGIALLGADQLSYLKVRTVEAIHAAHTAGFTVREDLSIIDRSGGARRVMPAQQHAAAIATRAAALIAADREIAARIRNTTTVLDNPGFTDSPADRSVQALDSPLQPPPGPSYPVNDVIAEATDLDGNHVILRRGYFDGKRGFGWDKIYHKHGVTNPNVFSDLISHSRPIKSEDGELVYRVRINRARCASKLGGLVVSCEDTGESLEMMIVVDTTEKRADVSNEVRTASSPCTHSRAAAASSRCNRIGQWPHPG